MIGFLLSKCLLFGRQNELDLGCLCLMTAVSSGGAALFSLGTGAPALGCENLKKVVLPKSLKEPGYGAFGGCYGFEEAALLRRTKGRRTAFGGATEVTIVDPLPSGN